MDNDPKATNRPRTERVKVSKDPPETIKVPRLTQDQEHYIRTIWEATGKYDPDAMISGPRRHGSNPL